MNNHSTLFAAEPVPFSGEPDKRKSTTHEGMVQKIHRHAQEATPTNVSVPANWPGLVVWALGQYGPWVLFVVSTWLLYNDNKANHAEMIEVAKSQIAVNSQTVGQLTRLEAAITALAEEAKKGHKP